MLPELIRLKHYYSTLRSHSLDNLGRLQHSDAAGLAIPGRCCNEACRPTGHDSTRITTPPGTTMQEHLGRIMLGGDNMRRIFGR